MNPSLALNTYVERPAAPAAAPRAAAAASAVLPPDTGAAPTGGDAGPRPMSWTPQSSRRRGMLVAVGLVHLAAGWALAHAMLRAPVPAKPTPVQVRLIAPAPPPPVQAAALPKIEMKLPLLAPQPLLPPPPVSIASPLVVAAVDPTPAASSKATTAAPAAAPAAHPSSLPPPSLRELPPGAVRYLVEPQLHVPRMSRRLGESGTVLLHIVVDASGALKSAVVKKSSGFERLDQQALQDIRSARFEPYAEKGQPLDWEADAGLQYELR